ncbi:MAG: ribose-phosphate diphosphokinase [Steroidobacterales bacterium]
MNGSTQPLLVALHESQPLAHEISARATIPIAPIEERPFEEGEFKLRPLASVRDRQLFIIQSLAGSDDAPVADRLVRLLFLLFGLHDAGAARMTAVIPYLTFARKDRRTQPRDPVNSRYIAQLLEATRVDRIITLDVHNPAALDNSFRIPVDHLSAIPLFVDHFATYRSDSPLAVASPDVGGIKRAQIFRELLAQRLGRAIELAFIEKRRADDVVTSGRVVGSVAGKEVIVLDDLCASGGTLVRAAMALRAEGAKAVHAVFTHAPLARGLAALAADKAIDHVVLTDSVGAESFPATGKFRVLPVAPLFAQAISRITAGNALAPLLRRWPVQDDATD